MAWREPSEKNNRPRIIWKKILGKPLRSWLIYKFKQGKSNTNIWFELKGHIYTYFDMHYAMGKPSKLSITDVLDKAKISITARWSEFNEDRK